MEAFKVNTDYLTIAGVPLYVISIFVMIFVIISAITVVIIMHKIGADELIIIPAIIAIIICVITCVGVYGAYRQKDEEIRIEEEQQAEEIMQRKERERKREEREKQEKEKEELNKKFETYKIMIDGTEVDIDDIDISLYNYNVNDKKETIYMTGK